MRPPEPERPPVSSLAPTMCKAGFPVPPPPATWQQLPRFQLDPILTRFFSTYPFYLVVFPSKYRFRFQQKFGPNAVVALLKTKRRLTRHPSELPPPQTPYPGNDDLKNAPWHKDKGVVVPPRHQERSDHCELTCQKFLKEQHN